VTGEKEGGGENQINVKKISKRGGSSIEKIMLSGS